MALWAVATLCGPGPELQGGRAAAAGLGDQDAAAAATATGGGSGSSTGGPSGPLLLPPGWLRRVTEQALTRQRLAEYSAQVCMCTRVCAYVYVYVCVSGRNETNRPLCIYVCVCACMFSVS